MLPRGITTQKAFMLFQRPFAKIVTPADLFNPALWLRPEDLPASGEISTWTDASGNGRHLTQATSANRPVVLANALNGFRGASFDGVNDFLNASGWTDNYTNLTITMVFRSVSFANFQVLFGKTGGDSYNILQTSGLPYMQGSPSVFATNPLTLNTDQIIQAEAQSTTIRHFLNGVANGTGTTTRPSSANAYRVGSTGIEAISGRIYELLIYNKILNSTERASVTNYLKSKYNL